MNRYKPFPNVTIDEYYVDKYIELCEKNENTKQVRRQTQRHHILPAGKTAFPEFKKERWNVINVPYFEHVLLHWYLFKAFRSYHSVMSLWRLLGFTKHPLVDKLENQEEVEMLAKIAYEVRQQFYDGIKHPYTQRKRIWVTNGDAEYFILPEEEENYLSKNFIRGRSQQTRKRLSEAHKRFVMSEEQKEKIRQHHLSVSQHHHMKSPEKRAWAREQAKKNLSKYTKCSVGKRMVFKDGVQAFVDESELNVYLANGWENTSARKGKTKEYYRNNQQQKHQKSYLHKDGKEICVKNKDRAKLMLEGWQVGRLNDSSK